MKEKYDSSYICVEFEFDKVDFEKGYAERKYKVRGVDTERVEGTATTLIKRCVDYGDD